jgi:hypothetical protein
VPTLKSGPWQGVYDSITSAVESQQFAQQAVNCSVRDGVFYARPATVQLATSALVGGGTNPRRGQCIHDHVATDGTIYRFLVVGGHIFRWDGVDADQPVDVTPGGLVLGTAGKVHMTSFGDEIIVTDGTATPQRLSNLAGSPISRTSIDVDGIGSSWTATGKPAVYAAKLFFILKSLAGTNYGNAIVWSEEASAGTGYKQSAAGFANFWELTQGTSEQIYAIHGTENGFYYFRERSIGVIFGKVNADFIAAATQDTVSLTVGTRYAATIVQTDNYLWWADRWGRPHRMALGGKPEPIWSAMRTAVTEATPSGVDNLGSAGSTSGLDAFACAAYAHDTNLVHFALYGGDATVNSPARVTHKFDATTGIYQGYDSWMAPNASNPTTSVFASPSTRLLGAWVDALGTLRNSSGRACFCMLGVVGTTYATSGNQGRFWRQQLRLTRGFYDYDAFTATYTPLIAAIVTQLMPDESDVEFIGNQLSVTTSFNTSGGSLWMVRRTPRSTSSGLASAIANASDQPFEGHGRSVWGLGASSRGRWLRFLFAFDASVSGGTFPANNGVPFGFESVSATGTAVSADPVAP